MNAFYVYAYFRPTGEPCYIGKGKENRWSRHQRETSNPHLRRIIALAGGSLSKIKVAEGLTEKEAFALEIVMIRLIGRRENGGPLVNLTDGGEGSTGMSAEGRAAISARHKGIPKTAEQRAAMRVPKGPMSAEAKLAIAAGQARSPKMPEARRKMAATLTGVPKTPEHVQAVVAARTGYRPSETTCAKMSASAKARGLHPNLLAALKRPRGALKEETRLKISATQKGKPKSPQAIAAATAARNESFALRRSFNEMLGSS